MDAWLRNFGSNLAHAGATIHAHLDSFGQDTGRRLDAWGKDVGQHMDPSHPVHQAMVIAGSVSFVAANEASRVLGVARQQTQHSVTGAYNNVHWYVAQVPWEQLAQEVQVVVQKKAEELGLVAAAQTVFCVSKEVPREILEWIEKHPGQTAFIIIAGTVFFVPELITVPVLWSLGFTKEGVVGGSAAAVMQSMIGPVQAGSIFALLQSAAAGGAGAAVVNGLTTATSGVTIAAAAAK